MNQTIQKEALLLRPTPPNRTPGPEHHAPFGLRTVAIFEAAKGMLVLIAGLGLLSLVHRDAQRVAEEIVRLMHLDAARRYPHIFIDFAGNLTDKRLWLFSLAALVYSTVRFVEAFGLWHERPWAEWFAVVSAALYLPVELLHFLRKHDWAGAGVFLVNLGIVIYLIYILATNSKHKREREKPGPEKLD